MFAVTSQTILETYYFTSTCTDTEIHKHISTTYDVPIGRRSRIDEFTERQLSSDQRTDEWLQQRTNYITASVAATCAGLMGPVARTNQLLEKATNGKYRTFFGGYYTDTGNIFEEVTNDVYCYVRGRTIHEFGLIPSQIPGYEFLGASTDGVATSLSDPDLLLNIEIKTLVGRKLDASKVKKEYYHQMQQQMACLDLPATDFIEVKYETCNSIDALAKHSCTKHAVGVIIECWNEETQSYTYLYSKPHVNVNMFTFEDDDATTPAADVANATSTSEKVLGTWVHETVIKRILDPSSTLTYVAVIPWYMEGFLCRRIERDPTWISTVGPLLKTFWSEVETLRTDADKLAAALKAEEERKQAKAGISVASRRHILAPKKRSLKAVRKPATATKTKTSTTT